MRLILKLKQKVKNSIREHIPTEVLISKGMNVGENFFRGKDVEIDFDFCWLIEIGNNVTLAPGSRILAHDASIRRSLGYSRIGTVIIGSNVFIGADSIILPGVRIGDNTIIGAGSVVTRNIENDSVYAGNPAKRICSLNEYLLRHDNITNFYIEKETFKNGNLSIEDKQKIKDEILKNGGISYSK